jgi:hypothetical protein
MQPDFRKRIPISLLVFGLTILGYGLSYVFQFGYLHFFGISRIAIEIDVPSIILSMIFIIFALAMLDNIADMYRSLVAGFRNDPYIGRFIIAFLRSVFIIVPLLILVNYALGSNNWDFVWLMSILIVFSLLLEPLGYIFKARGLTPGLKSFYASRDSRVTRIDEGYMSRYSTHVVYVAGLFIISAAVGRLWASSQDTAYVLSQDNNIKEVLIQRYPDTLISKNYDNLQRKFTPGFSIKKLDSTLYLSDRISIKAK